MSDPNTPETGITPITNSQKDQPGYTPMLEVHRLIRENGPNLAPKLFEDYKDHFEDPSHRNEEGFYEDPVTKVVLQNSQTHRVIRVFIGAENSNKTGYSLYNFASIAFDYLKDNHNTWKYDGATIHPSNKAGGGYISTKLIPQPGDPSDTYFWQSGINMADLEHSLGKYLNLSLPEPETKQSGFHRLLSKFKRQPKK